MNLEEIQKYEECTEYSNIQKYIKYRELYKVKL